MVIYGINSCMSQLVFPQTLDQDLSSAYGNQFARIVINVDTSDGKSAAAVQPKIKIAETGKLANNETIKNFRQGILKEEQKSDFLQFSQESRQAKHYVYLPVPVSLSIKIGRAHV